MLHLAIRDCARRCFSKFIQCQFCPVPVLKASITIVAVTESYRQLIEHVDKLTARLSSQYARHLVCRSGCSGCCRHHLSVFAVEAAAVRQAVDVLPEPLRQRLTQQAHKVLEMEAHGEPTACPMLVDDRCSIYAARPLICRTQGLPLLLEADDGEAEVDFCPLNFTAPEDRKSVV